MSGVLVVDKPVGLTSARAVAIVKRRAGGVRTGHAGTLDPLATGVLVIALGKATKIIERLMNTSKRYRTAIDLSAFTTTDDAEGERLDVERAGGVGGVGCVGGRRRGKMLNGRWRGSRGGSCSSRRATAR